MHCIVTANELSRVFCDCCPSVEKLHFSFSFSADILKSFDAKTQDAIGQLYDYCLYDDWPGPSIISVIKWQCCVPPTQAHRSFNRVESANNHMNALKMIVSFLLCQWEAEMNSPNEMMLWHNEQQKKIKCEIWLATEQSENNRSPSQREMLLRGLSLLPNLTKNRHHCVSRIYIRIFVCFSLFCLNNFFPFNFWTRLLCRVISFFSAFITHAPLALSISAVSVFVPSTENSRKGKVRARVWVRDSVFAYQFSCLSARSWS